MMRWASAAQQLTVRKHSVTVPPIPGGAPSVPLLVVESQYLIRPLAGWRREASLGRFVRLRQLRHAWLQAGCRAHAR